MRNNEQYNQDLQEHLINWINTALPQQPYCHSLSQVNQKGIIIRLLSLVDGAYFGRLQQHQHSSIPDCIAAIEMHLQTFMGKTIRLKYQEKLMSDENIVATLGVVLYECVHCYNREEFIKQILTLSTETQRCLMDVIQVASSQIDNTVQIKQILIKVDQLQQLNQQLKNQISEQKKQSFELAERLDQAQADLKALEEQCEAYRKQKNQAVRQLGLSEFGQYIQMFKTIQSEKMDLVRQLEQSQVEKEHLKNDKESYKAKILQDGQLISELNQQIQRFKSMCKTLRLNNSFSLLDLQTTQQNARCSLDNYALKQNYILSNLESSSASLSVRRKPNESTIYMSEPYLKLLEQVRQYTSRCQSLEAVCQDSREQVIKLNRVNAQLTSDNQFLNQQLDTIRGLHMELRRLVF